MRSTTEAGIVYDIANKAVNDAVSSIIRTCDLLLSERDKGMALSLALGLIAAKHRALVSVIGDNGMAQVIRVLEPSFETQFREEISKVKAARS